MSNIARKSDREYNMLFKEPEFSYCFNAAEPVEIYKDNTYDHYLYRQGELCTFEYEWEKEIKDFD